MVSTRRGREQLGSAAHYGRRHRRMEAGERGRGEEKVEVGIRGNG
jgi:hypothetical protein